MFKSNLKGLLSTTSMKRPKPTDQCVGSSLNTFLSCMWHAAQCVISSHSRCKSFKTGHKHIATFFLKHPSYPKTVDHCSFLLLQNVTQRRGHWLFVGYFYSAHGFLCSRFLWLLWPKSFLGFAVLPASFTNTVVDVRYYRLELGLFRLKVRNCLLRFRIVGACWVQYTA